MNDSVSKWQQTTAAAICSQRPYRQFIFFTFEIAFMLNSRRERRRRCFHFRRRQHHSVVRAHEYW